MIFEYTIGKIGIDIARISYDVQEEYGASIWEWLYKKYTIGDTRIKANANKIEVRIDKDRLICGKVPRLHKYYISLEIHAARMDGNNIENLSMEKLKKRYDDLAFFFGREYQITILQEQKDTARFTYLELNTTVIADRSYEEYARFLKLLCHQTGKKISIYGNSKDPNRFRMETICASCDTYEIKIYDKTKEMKKKIDVDINDNLIRFEYTLKKPKPIESAFGQIPFVQFSDNLLREEFNRRFVKLSKKGKKYLCEKLQYSKDAYGKKNTVANIIAANSNNGYIANPQSIIGEILAYEIHYNLPLLFDLRDIKLAIADLMRLGILSTNFIHDDYYQQLQYVGAYEAEVLQNQHEKSGSIWGKLLHDYEQKIQITQ